jgi:AcrR family transcriptional regulator
VPGTAPRPLRADAQRNRDRLVAVAVRAFATAGPAGSEVTLDAVAKEAGVGIGTLYRHFPDRDALLEAAYRSEVEALCDVEGLLRDRPPDLALAAWMDRFVDYAVTKRGMSAALRSVVASGADISRDTRRRVLGALATLLAAGIGAGTVRADVSPEDVLRATGAIWMIPDEEGWAADARRVLALLMDGLRHGAG